MQQATSGRIAIRQTDFLLDERLTMFLDQQGKTRAVETRSNVDSFSYCPQLVFTNRTQDMGQKNMENFDIVPPEHIPQSC